MTAIISLSQIQFMVAVAGGPGGARDWVGIFEIGTDNDRYLDWRYLANNSKITRPTVGVTSGTVSLSVPSVNGDYEVRFLSASGRAEFVELTPSLLFSFGDTKGAVINLSPSPSGGDFTLLKPDGTVWGTVRVI